MNFTSAKEPRNLTMAADPNRVDYHIISSLIAHSAKVLDVGASSGALLALLQEEKDVDGRGIELSQAGVSQAVSRGLSIVQGDADTDLIHYPDHGFDFVVLSQTIQATRDPKAVLKQLMRIGKKVIVSFPNFGHWHVRLKLLKNGRMPVTKDLPYTWYDTPNIHFCTITDFVSLCDELDVNIDQFVVLSKSRKKLKDAWPLSLKNALGDQAVMLLSQR